jgi:hypothetical protein
LENRNKLKYQFLEPTKTFISNSRLIFLSWNTWAFEHFAPMPQIKRIGERFKCNPLSQNLLKKPHGFI